MTALPAPPTDLAIPGYRIHKLLGQGGMATVYLATQEKLKRQVALKVILPQHAQDADFRERFISEGQLTARLFHRHVMTVFDIGEHNGCYFMATEVLSGGTLAEKLPTITSVVDKLLIVREVAEGLGYAHQHQVIHRDIKPGNVLFRADGTAVVADFGIAKALDMTRAQTVAGMIVGTPSYMSPEQVQGQPLDGRSDLYSLGIMFYQMLTGVLPFVAGDLFAVAMAQIARQADPLPTHLRPLQPLLNSMIEKLPERRIASAEALCESIDALLPTLDDAALSAAPSPPASSRLRITGRKTAVRTMPPGGPTVTRRRWPALVGASSAVLAVVAVTLATWHWKAGDAGEAGGTAPAVSAPTTALGADDAWKTLAGEVRSRIAQRRYFAPAGGSAHDALKLMLLERPTDIDALELATTLCRAVADDAMRLLDAGDRSQASLLVSQAVAHFPNDPLIGAVMARLSGDSTASTQPVRPDATRSLNDLRRLATEATAAKRISSPPGDNAVAYLREILRRSPDDATARGDLQRIADAYARTAQGLIDEGKLGLANAAVLRGLEAMPGDPQLTRLRARTQAP